MGFFAHLGVNLHVCLRGDLQATSAQALDFFDIDKRSSFPDGKADSTGKSFPAFFAPLGIPWFRSIPKIYRAT
ncbi:hypothetical protein TRIP_B40079 [uncultured Desulfatiglans sp.]|uniref:Uncharacterized protein n=1 Tax=Uncultured Desulfatiglans sp. TaxID=1748965 RepID=A0A653ADM2_UNCDX|nr:hypothetical protein TRIP_B40079 [uncultured Desulfatiglans sp.]